MTKTIYFADAHCPYLDLDAWKNLLDLVKFERPQKIVNLGDWIDFYQISKFNKDPQRVLQLQADLDFAIARQEELRKVAGSRTRIYYKGGNHDGDRLASWLNNHPEVKNLRSLSLPVLLELDRYQIEYIPPFKPFKLDGLVVTHGSYIAAQAGASGMKELLARGTSGISGHVHRSGLVHKSYDFGGEFWIEVGCLCDLDPPYRNDRPFDWQQTVWIIETINNGNQYRKTEVPL